ncbi:hypothetical protein ACP70R_011945 [Stipagrostis hirtigluma subsp. patula]
MTNLPKASSSTRGRVASKKPSGLSLVRCIRCKLQDMVELTYNTTRTSMEILQVPTISGAPKEYWLDSTADKVICGA